MQMSIPRFKEAQSGPGAPQSAHFSLPSTFFKRSIGFSTLTLCLCCWKLCGPPVFEETSSVTDGLIIEEHSKEPLSVVELGSFCSPHIE